MKKIFKFIILCISAMIILSTTVFATRNGMFEGFKIIRVTVDSNEVKGDTPAILFKGRTMVPLRFVTEAMGATVDWDSETETAIIQSSNESSQTNAIDVNQDEIDNLKSQIEKLTSKKEELEKEIEALKKSDEYVNVTDFEITMTDGSVAKYTGKMKNELRDGYGKTIYSDGVIHEGMYSIGIANGLGTFTTKTGSTLKGNYLFGVKHGIFKQTLSDGSFIFTEYDNDKQVNTSLEKFYSKSIGDFVIAEDTRKDNEVNSSKFYIPSSLSSNTSNSSNNTTPSALSTSYNWSNFYLLEGCDIVAQDGTYLGVISKDKYDDDSISNKYGKYGSKYENNSIFNTYGTYGSKYETYSPLNKYCSEPPIIYDGSTAVAYLTTNTLLTPRVDTTELMNWIESNE